MLSSNRLSTGLPSPSFKLQADRPVLSEREVVYVGEPIAVVVAESRAMAEDAIDAVTLEFETLPVVNDCRAGLKSGPTAHRELPHNCIADLNFSYGDVEHAFGSAAHIVRGSYAIHRGGSHSMEGRGVLAIPNELTGSLHVWSSTQTPQSLKNALCELLASG